MRNALIAGVAAADNMQPWRRSYLTQARQDRTAAKYAHGRAMLAERLRRNANR